MFTPFWLHPHLLFWDLNKNDLSHPTSAPFDSAAKKALPCWFHWNLKISRSNTARSCQQAETQKEMKNLPTHIGAFWCYLVRYFQGISTVQCPNYACLGSVLENPQLCPSTQKHSNQASWLPSFQIDWFAHPLDMQWQKTIVITWWYKTVLQKNNMQLPVNKHTHLIYILRYTPKTKHGYQK